jgi:hypothetical protein
MCGMGIFSALTGANEPNYVTIGSRAFQCMFCAGDRFWYRSVKMNTGGMEFLDLGWANQSSHGLICVTCGYVHEFMGDNVQLWDRAPDN